MEGMNVKEEFIELRAKGYSFDRIAKKLGKAKQTLIDWSKELQEEIANRKALELDSLYEQYFLLKEARLQTFGEILGRIKAEAMKRDLSDVPTDKLLDLLLKYNALITEEFIEPSFKATQELIDGREERRVLDGLTAPPREILQEVRRLKAG